MTTIRKAPDMTGHARVDLQPSAFDALVHQKGLDVTWESSVRCPCKPDGRSNLPTCQNCGGIGFVFINPVKTKMFVQSLNLTTKMAQWSVEKVGLATISCRSIDDVGDMDRITLDKSRSKMSQVLYPKIYNGKLFAFTHYPIISILEIFMFQKDDAKLVKIDPAKYSFDAGNNKVIFDKKLYKQDLSITIRYIHKVQYFIVDMPREIRETMVLDGSKDDVGKLPVSAIGRRCHYIINPDKFTGSATLNNSYDTN